MMSYRNEWSTIIGLIAIATLLSYLSPVSSFIFPRVTRTRDAIIINFADEGYAALNQGKNSEIANPGFIPVPSINPVVHPMFYKGWYGHPSLSAPIGALSKTQFDKNEEDLGEIQVVKQGTTLTTTSTPAPDLQCGRGPSTMPAKRSLISERVAGGIEAKKNVWPFMAIMLFSHNTYCGGTLISDSKVLLAAQCLERMNMIEIFYTSFSIGLHSTSNAPITRRINKVVLHSQFSYVTYANDIAIVTLDSPVPFSRTVGPVCLPAQSADPDQYVDQDAVVMGWDSSSVLKQGKVSIVSNSECRSMQNIGQYVSNTTTCISSTGVFTCSKDVGGPVMIMSSPGIWTQVGINSYTPSCSSSGLKTRVSAFRTWIDQYIN